MLMHGIPSYTGKSGRADIDEEVRSLWFLILCICHLSIVSFLSLTTGRIAWNSWKSVPKDVQGSRCKKWHLLPNLCVLFILLSINCVFPPPTEGLLFCALLLQHVQFLWWHCVQICQRQWCKEHCDWPQRGRIWVEKVGITPSLLKLSTRHDPRLFFFFLFVLQATWGLLHPWPLEQLHASRHRGVQARGKEDFQWWWEKNQTDSFVNEVQMLWWCSVWNHKSNDWPNDCVITI